MQKYLLFAFCMIFISVTSARALFYDFSNKAQLDDWTVIGGKWNIEQGALSGEDAPGAAGPEKGYDVAADHTACHAENDVSDGPEGRGAADDPAGQKSGRRTDGDPND